MEGKGQTAGRTAYSFRWRAQWAALKQARLHPAHARWGAIVIASALAYAGWRVPAADTNSELSVLALARDIEPGAALVLGDLTLMPRVSAPTAIGEAMLERVEGALAARALTRGDPLYPSDIEWGHRLRSRVPAGHLAYALSLHEGPTLTEGDSIDLFWIGADGNTQNLLESVPVLQVRARLPPVVALTPEQIGWVESAARRGTLQAAVKSSRDPKARSRGRAPKTKRARPKVDIWEGE